MKTDFTQSTDNHPSLIELFGAFLKLGLTAFGGPAMIAYIREMTVEKRRWIDKASFQNGAALCQVIPGATVMQMAAYIGLKTRGIAGADAAFIGFGLPAFFLMTALSVLYGWTHELPAVIHAFYGLQAVIVAIIANAALSFGKPILRSQKPVLLAIVAAALFWLMANPVLIVSLAALTGILFKVQSEKPSSPISEAQRCAPTATLRSFGFLSLAAACGFGLLFWMLPSFFELALLMSKIDLIAFGGGFTSVPLLFHEIVEIRNWMDGPTFLNGIALGQFTPGPIVITATFVG
jgi:chromate transporter